MEASPDALAILDDEERERAARLRQPDDRKHFVAAHVLARVLIGNYLGCAPEALRMGKSEKGKPFILRAGGMPDLRFNVSRSGEYAAFALSLAREIGMDVEEIAARSGLNMLIERALSENERAGLRALPLEERERAFFRYWSRKEAYLKARGLGLSVPPDQVDTAAPDLLRVNGAPETGWRIEDVALGPGYAAAVAGEGRDWRVTAVRAVTVPARY